MERVEADLLRFIRLSLNLFYWYYLDLLLICRVAIFCYPCVCFESNALFKFCFGALYTYLLLFQYSSPCRGFVNSPMRSLVFSYLLECRQLEYIYTRLFENRGINRIVAWLNDHFVLVKSARIFRLDVFVL